MKLKKLLVAALAVTMIMGSSSMAFAAEQKGEGTGAGDLDVVKDTDVFSVVVPTDSATTFDYIVDPLGVIKDTNAEKYGNKTFEDGQTVYFQNAEVTSSEAGGSPYNYSGTSNKLEAINKSTKEVDIKVEASLTKTDEVTMAEATAVTGTTDTLLNLQVHGTDGTNAADKAMKADAAVDITGKIAEKANAYETKYVNGKYVKQLKSGLENKDFNKYQFWLTGKANASSDWKDVATLPEVKLVWTVSGEGAEVATGPQVTLSTSGLITMSGLTKEANIVDASKDMTLGINGNRYPLNTKAATWITDEWDATNGGTLKAQLKTDYSAFNGKEVGVDVKLSNGTTISCTGTVNIQ